MNKRERVLVIAMVAAVSIGGASVFLDGSGKKSGKTGKTGADLDVQAFADAQRVALASVRLSTGEKLALNKVAAPWADSPFIDRMSSIQTDDGSVTEFRYTGFMQVGDNKLAIINGREYSLAEKIIASDFIIESIEPDHIVLGVGKGGRRVTIPLQTVNARRNMP